MGGTLKVATYNVHRCVGTDGREDAGRVAAVLAELDADVVVLQEVESRPSRTRLRQGEDLARRTGRELLEGPLLFEGAGQYGNAILSRFPLAALRRHRFPRAGREARGFMRAELVDGDGLPLAPAGLSTRPDRGPGCRGRGGPGGPPDRAEPAGLRPPAGLGAAAGGRLRILRGRGTERNLRPGSRPTLADCHP